MTEVSRVPVLSKSHGSRKVNNKSSMESVMGPFFQWLRDTEIADAIRTSTFLFPTIESVHVLAISLVVGSIVIFDLRLLGLAWNSRPVSQIVSEIIPLTWIFFGVAAITGSLLFVSNAVGYANNIYFIVKMASLVLAFVNQLFFHVVTERNIAVWDSLKPPTSARAAGAISLVLWITIIACGRWIGFTIDVVTI